MKEILTTTKDTKVCDNFCNENKRCFEKRGDLRKVIRLDTWKQILETCRPMEDCQEKHQSRMDEENKTNK